MKILLVATGFLAHPAMFVSAATISATTVKIDIGERLQTIDGFGFSQAFTRASQFQNATKDLQKKALDLLFSTETGAGLSIIRNWIPSPVAYTIEPISPGLASNAPNYT